MDARSTQLFPRFAAAQVETALKDTPIVLVAGPRQCGKTTLVRSLVSSGREFITLDDDTILASARLDPAGLVRSLGKSTIDEIQRAPDLLRAIKLSVDDDRQPGRFLLTGSANLLAVPLVSESLAGRMEIVNLMPLSQAEIHRRKPNFLPAAFTGKPCRAGEPMTGRQLVDAVLSGGYPEMLRRRQPDRRRAWARDYVRAIVQRDVRDIAEVEKLAQMPRLVQVLTHYSGQLTNFTEIGAQAGFDDKTTRKYIGILEQLRPSGRAARHNSRTDPPRPQSLRPPARDLCLHRTHQADCVCRQWLRPLSLSRQGPGGGRLCGRGRYRLGRRHRSQGQRHRR